jgi:valyl-tRNA synthetase
MIFSSLEFTKKIPFKEVYINPTVLAITGQRMSKSLGTGVDPLEIGEKYGFDAVRMGLIYQTSRDQQAFKFDERAILASRNFINKLWNISRFIKMSVEKTPNKFKILTLADKWILSRLNTIIESTTKKIKNYQFGEAIRELYDFVWHEFADWYLEIAKFQISNPKTKNSTALILYNSLLNILKLLHPFIPFVSEAIYQLIANDEQQKTKLLMIENWPKANKKLINKKAENDFEKIKELIVEIRNFKAKEKIPFNEIKKYQIKEPSKIILANQEMIENLAKVKLIFCQI